MLMSEGLHVLYERDNNCKVTENMEALYYISEDD